MYKVTLSLERQSLFSEIKKSQLSYVECVILTQKCVMTCGLEQAQMPTVEARETGGFL